MLKGKVAVVTGSTSGIGLGIASALAQQGADIVLNGFGDAAEIEKVRAGLASQHGVRVVYDGADLSKGEAVRGLIDNAVRQLGRIDILVNNAGIQHTAPIEDFPVEKWDAIIALNLSAVFHGTAAALPYMKKQGFGRIINIASAHGLVASAFKSAYVAAKHGVVGFTKVTALETAGQGITANAICPAGCAPAGREADHRAGREERRGSGSRRPRTAQRKAALAAICHAGTAGRHRRLPGVRRRRADHRHHHFRRRRLDRALISGRNSAHAVLLSPPRNWTTTRRCTSRRIPSPCSSIRPPA